MTQLNEQLSFGESGRLVHDFLWDEFADWYIEASKVRILQLFPRTLAAFCNTYVYDKILCLLNTNYYFCSMQIRMRPPSTASTSSVTDLEAHAAQQAQSRRVLVYVWDTCMRLLHPFMPFLTGETEQQILKNSE